MEFSENKPIYLQLADQIMDSIVAKGINSVTRLPSVREYAGTVGVNANTVMRTYTYLQQEGIIYNQRGIGYFFSSGSRELVRDLRRKELINKEMKIFMEKLKAADISPDEFKAIYEEYLQMTYSPS